MNKNHWIGVLMGLCCWWLGGCAVDREDWEIAERVCADNDEVEMIYIGFGTDIHCNNGAEFKLYRLKEK